MCGFKFLHGDVGGGNACRYLKVGISIISSRGTQFKCNKMRGLPIKICKCADQPKVCLLNAGPKCYWTSVFVSVLPFFFPYRSLALWALLQHLSTLCPTSSAPRFPSAPPWDRPRFHCSWVGGGWADPLVFNSWCRHAECMSTMNTWSASLRRCESVVWHQHGASLIRKQNWGDCWFFFFLLPVGMLWRNVCLSVCPERNTGCFTKF